MIYQAGLDKVSELRGKLQIAGIPFHAAQSVSAAALRRAAESEQAFLSLVERLKERSEQASLSLVERLKGIEVGVADLERHNAELNRAAEIDRAMRHSRRKST